jgi:hypothetical protein
MKNLMLFVLFVSALKLMSASVTVDGHVYLEGETDHSGIKVILQRVAPDTLYSYTVYSDASGYYFQTVEQGIYDVDYEKLKYQRIALEGVSLYSDHTIPDQTLIFTNELWGYVSGTLERGTHPISETITIDFGDTLIVEPGVTMEFYSDVEFIVNGHLIAQGAENDSIKFTSHDGGTWLGLSFGISTSDNCVIEKCIIENSSADGIYLDNCSLRLTGSSLRNNYCAVKFLSPAENYLKVDNCEFINNSSDGDYSSIVFTRNSGANTTIENCLFKNNVSRKSVVHAYQAGKTIVRGSVFTENSVHTYGMLSNYFGGVLEVDSCIISDNTVTTTAGGVHKVGAGKLILKSTTVERNVCYSSGAVNNTDGEIFVSNCIIRYNTSLSSSGSGGGMLLTGGTAFVENSEIYANSAYYGAGISSNCDAMIVNCVISNNNGHGIYAVSVIDLQNCIVSGNTNYAVYNFYSTNLPVIEYNNFYSNTPSNFFRCNEYLGVDVTTNSNGDPCDAWGNMSMDPLFLDEWNGDYMLTENSPCIDAGTNSIADYEFPLADLSGNYRVWDGNGDSNAIVDMGAYEYGAPVGIEEHAADIQNFVLYQNYPNPFNPVTTISYALPKSGIVELNVYNLNGQLVQSLVNGRSDKGIHKAEFNGADITSGMYIYNLKVDGKSVQSKKMMLLK